MDSTSKPIELDLRPDTDEITFEGWQLLESHLYDLWLSPCGTKLVQHYVPQVEGDVRIMRSGYVHDLNIQDYIFRNILRMGQIIGYKTYDFQIVHEFAGCHWYGQDATWPEDLPLLLRDFESVRVSWPTLRPANLYRNPEGELRVIGPALAFEYGSLPLNLNYWAALMTPDELKEAESHLTMNGLDTRPWVQEKFGGYL